MAFFFKLVKDKRTFDTPIKCLLVVPEKFENSVFHMFHGDACQQQKQKRGKTQYFHPRIPLSYNPMSYISADIKYMPKGIYDYEFLTHWLFVKLQVLW